MRPEEVVKPNDGTGVLEGEFFYNMLILGSTEGLLNLYGYASTVNEFEQWQESIGILDPKLHQRKADHLRAGEQVRLIAINRVTGYIGTLRTELKSASDGSSHEISFAIDAIEMRPPNLKIWAKRFSGVDSGLTSGEIREHQIGNEGAGLDNDIQIEIYTEWFDHDGSPLPETLTEQYAYTGRFAQVVEGFKLDTVSYGVEEPANSLSHFAIRPGRHIQVVRLPDPVAGKQHLYIQVSAEPATENPDFGSSGIHQGILQHRPDKYVPFMVPLFDEDETNLSVKAWRVAKQTNTNLDKPDPVYQWVYRPEFQFSVYSLMMNEVRRETFDEETTDILDFNQPSIHSLDNLVELYYNLTTTEYAPLQAWSYQDSKELVFALGEEEIIATLGDNQTLEFKNLDHLGMLQPDDYLTVRLYANNDTSNVLWEWAFESGLIVTSYLPEEYKLAPVLEPNIQNDLYRLLGGVRLEYKYELPQDAIPTNYVWTFNTLGRFCAEKWTTSNNCNTTTTRQGQNLNKVYWEPNEWLSNLNVAASVHITYLQDGEQKQLTKNFNIKTRELSANANDPMEGTDVAMLEDLLWHIGISPQYGWSGIGAYRIGYGTVPDPTGNTGTPRHKYISGYDFQCVIGTVTYQRRIASIEKMVRRFKGLHEYNGTSYDVACAQFLKGVNGVPGSQDHIAAGDNTDGTVDDTMLQLLKRHHDQYVFVATSPQYSSRDVLPVRNNAAEVNQWATAAIAQGWDNNLGNGALYTNAVHTTAFSGDIATRQDLLREWIEHEAGNAFWGTSRYNFRMTMGGADEWGSLGFNQILFQAIYGSRRNDCPQLTNRSQYDPVKNAENMTLFMSIPTSNPNCPSPLFRALRGIPGNLNRYRVPYVNNDQAALNRPRVRGYCREISPTGGCAANDFTAVAEQGQTIPDDYEQIVKAIMAYNGGNSTMDTHPAIDTDSWIGRLIRQNPTSVGSAFREHYSISIRQAANLRRRSYVLQWTYTQQDFQANQSFNVGDQVCFIYGEDNWHNGQSWQNILRALNGVNDLRYVNCNTGQH